MKKCQSVLFQKAPPLAGELSVNDSEQTEGEQLAALGTFEPFPFRHGLRRDTFPVNGDGFNPSVNPPCGVLPAPRRGEPLGGIHKPFVQSRRAANDGPYSAHYKLLAKTRGRIASPQLYDLSRSPAVRWISHCSSNISLRFSAISPCVSRISPLS